ncbi:MAG: ArsR/SmtB family transcription factor [Thermodesulfobacteriota bacterium]
MQKRPLNTVECAAALKAMSDKTRLLILKVLFKGEKCGTELARELHASQPHIAHHLNILKKAGLVDSRRDGKRVCYSLHRAVHEAMQDSDRQSINLGCCTMTFKGE